VPKALSVDHTNFDRSPLLLAEDNRDDVVIMRRALQKAGFENPIHVAGDGADAIAFLDGQGVYADREKYPLPVIALLDMNLPQKSGLEVLQWIRSRPERRLLTVYILTASDRASDVASAFDAGAHGYLTKPARLDDLVEMLRSFRTFARYQIFPALG
jgi:CheY-like chemotaxis protein